MIIICIKLLLVQISMPLLWFLSYVIPKQKNLYIFGATKQEKYQGNPKALFEYTSKNKKEIVAVFVTKNKTVEKYITKSKLLVERRFFKKMWFLLRAQYFFIETTPMDISPFYILLGRFNIINLWHGTPLKKIEADSKNLNKLYSFVTSFNNKRYQMIIATDKETRKHFASAFKNKNVQITGYPRNDMLFHKKRGDFSYLNYLNHYDKVITYAPTFRDNTKLTPFTEEGLNKIDNYCRKHNYIFLIKEHPNKQQIIINDKSNIKQVSKSIKDIQELMLYTDIMISDYSSLVFDYALLNRPIIFYPFDIEAYLSVDREMYYEYENIFPRPYAKNEMELLQYIKNVDTWFVKLRYQNSFQAFRRRFNFYRDGNSSSRIVDILK